MKILSFGEVLFDIIEEKEYLGGAPLNFIAHIAQCGLSGYMYSKVGDDDLGNLALEKMRELRVSTQFVQQDEQHPTGTVNVTLTDGQPEYTIQRSVAYDFIRYDSEVYKHHFDLIYFGSLAQRSDLSQITLKTLVEQNQFKHVFYDVNLRAEGYNRNIITHSMEMCTILKLNDGEVMVLSDLLFQHSLSMKKFCAYVSEQFGIGLILITAGEKGSYIYRHGVLEFITGDKVKVVDTVGAGDAFSAGFVYKFLKTGNALAASKTANSLGAFVASRQGAIPIYSEEVKRTLI
ncbi:carbohydrate kinase family protein [Fulvivirga sediminis]|uniref:Carbohydrate kinase n=1 Tax=Fulvivirga sediminis TaxID=2803949 RepID=A0A937F4H7_9BACT|nr:carbohydrate kinase [Fulvivirga sediminis]MBL3656222.1 carbohydrate kinase [Fulvivirga sediminis]